MIWLNCTHLFSTKSFHHDYHFEIQLMMVSYLSGYTSMSWSGKHLSEKNTSGDVSIFLQRFTSNLRPMCHGISIFPFGDLSAPGVSLRPPALVTLAGDVVKVRGTSNVVCKWRLPGPWHKPHHRTSSRCHTSRNDVVWHHLPALPSLNTQSDLNSRSLTISCLAAWTPLT